MTVIPQTALDIQWLEGMSQVKPQEWNSLAGASMPFLSWEWLHLLEASGSVGLNTGWLPFHLAVRRDGKLVGAAPLYIKGHSMGEFVFDQVWAEAAVRFGVRYYPKLVGMSPFTPVTGYRFLLDAQSTAMPADDPKEAILSAMYGAVDGLVRRVGLSGASFLFADGQFAADARRKGYGKWEHQTFLWENRGYQAFDGYLSRLNANRRRTIRRERRELADQGVTVRFVGQEGFTPELLALAHALYARTNRKFGLYSCKFLTQEFFNGLLGPAGASVLLGLAEKPGERDPLAMALFVRQGERLWGRYWGARRDLRFLHFELCMYAPIEWAIAQGIRLYDPGMGGSHKASRGFVSHPGVSLHRFAHPGLDLLFTRNIDHINELERAYMDEMNSLVPVRK